jgi:hypothetical protein
VIEDGPLKIPFAKTHVELKQRTQIVPVQEAIVDVVSMVDLAKK